jgi:hypothetical protein
MAATAWTMYSNAVLGVAKAQFNLNSDTFVLTLHTASYTPAPDTNALWSAVSSSELTTANGYTAGGKTLTTLATTLTAGTVKMDADDISWAAFSAGPFRYAVLTRRAGASLVAGDFLLCFSDLTGGGTLTGVGGAYNIVFDAAGILNGTHTP